MKNLSGAMLAHLAQSTTTLAEGWRVIRPDGTVYGFTSHDVAVVIDNITYAATPGLQATSAHTTDTMAVDTLDVTIFLAASDEADVAAGLWDNSLVTVFEYNWASPPTAFDNNLLILRHGNLGEVQRKTNMLQAEIRGVTQRLSRRIGRQYIPTCPWRHAQWSDAAGAFVSSVECGITLTSFLETGAVTSLGADPTLQFSASGSARADTYYAEGLIHFTSGKNAGVTREIASWVGKAFRLHRPLPYAAVIGDAYKAVRGDDKTWPTCRDVYANWLNFGGMPSLPGIAAVWSNPTGV